MGLALASVFAAGCRQATDESSVREREAGQIEGRLGATKVTLYRVAKTAVRSLPPRAAVLAAVRGRTELSREDWAR